MRLCSLLSLPLLFIVACNSPVKPTLRPQWINHPNLLNQTGAVGSCKPHIKGTTYQRRLAISRALDELAQQSGVTIENIVIREERNTRSSTSTHTHVQSQQRSTGEIIKARIQEIWTDPKNQEIYVWLIAD